MENYRLNLSQKIHYQRQYIKIVEKKLEAKPDSYLLRVELKGANKDLADLIKAQRKGNN